MPISINTIDALPDYSDGNLVKLYRWGLANNAAGQTRMVNGTSISFPSVSDMLKVIQWAEERANVDATGGDSALVQFGDPQ